MRNAVLNRIRLAGAVAAASALIATPTVVGLSGNTSFSRDLRVPVPSGAHDVRPSDLAPSSSPHHHSGGRQQRGTGGVEDRPGHDVAPSGTADDHGGLRTGGSSGPEPTSGSGGSSSGDDDRGGDDRRGRSGGGDG